MAVQILVQPRPTILCDMHAVLVNKATSSMQKGRGVTSSMHYKLYKVANCISACAYNTAAIPSWKSTEAVKVLLQCCRDRLNCSWVLCTNTCVNVSSHPAVWLSVTPSGFMTCVSIHTTHLLDHLT